MDVLRATSRARDPGGGYDAACVTRGQESVSAFAPGYIDSRDRAAAPSPRVIIYERIHRARQIRGRYSGQPHSSVFTQGRAELA